MSGDMHLNDIKDVAIYDNCIIIHERIGKRHFHILTFLPSSLCAYL